MTEFVIKSTISTIILYGFYHFVLRNVKIPIFNRFYLLFSLVFTIINSLVTVRMNVHLAISPAIKEFSGANGFLLQGEDVVLKPVPVITFQTILTTLYLFISFVLLLRFTLNIYKIVQVIRTSTILANQKTNIVLVNQKVLPYSFFKFIFLNRTEYEYGTIGKELILHEQAHCSQFHTIDVIAVELLKIVLWFNPFVWLFGKAIQLNHEYLADHKVLSNHDLNQYQSTLINLVFRNNSTYLASNFNYSLTKKRLIMMTKNKSKSTAYRIAMVPVIAILLFYFISCSREPNETANTYDSNKTEWWSSILKKHNIEPKAFNNFENIFEMGTKNSINDKVATLEDAVFIIKANNTGCSYVILKSKLAHHNLSTNLIEGDEGSIELYKTLADTKPFKSFSLIKFKYQLHNDKVKWDYWDAIEIN